MSAYRNFTYDFPNRCRKILELYDFDAKLRDREVTLMLALATSGFTIPFERLRKPSPQSQPHPSLDRGRFKKLTEKLDELVQLPFLSSEMCDGVGDSWIFSKEVARPDRDPDAWDELQNPKPLSSRKKTGTVLKHLRNALAHGNIFTQHNPIGLLIFLSRPCEECQFAMLAVSPEDFRKFLLNWFKFLDISGAPSVLIQPYVHEILDEAA